MRRVEEQADAVDAGDGVARAQRILIVDFPAVAVEEFVGEAVSIGVLRLDAEGLATEHLDDAVVLRAGEEVAVLEGNVVHHVERPLRGAFGVGVVEEQLEVGIGLEDDLHVSAAGLVIESHVGAGRAVERRVVAALELAEEGFLPGVVNRIVLTGHAAGHRAIEERLFEPLPPGEPFGHQLAGVRVGKVKRRVHVRVFDVEDLRIVRGAARVGEVDQPGDLLPDRIARRIPRRDEVRLVQRVRVDDRGVAGDVGVLEFRRGFLGVDAVGQHLASDGRGGVKAVGRDLEVDRRVGGANPLGRRRGVGKVPNRVLPLDLIDRHTSGEAVVFQAEFDADFPRSGFLGLDELIVAVGQARVGRDALGVETIGGDLVGDLVVQGERLRPLADRFGEVVRRGEGAVGGVVRVVHVTDFLCLDLRLSQSGGPLRREADEVARGGVVLVVTQTEDRADLVLPEFALVDAVVAAEPDVLFRVARARHGQTLALVAKDRVVVDRTEVEAVGQRRVAIVGADCGFLAIEEADLVVDEVVADQDAVVADTDERQVEVAGIRGPQTPLEGLAGRGTFAPPVAGQFDIVEGVDVRGVQPVALHEERIGDGHDVVDGELGVTDRGEGVAQIHAAHRIVDVEDVEREFLGFLLGVVSPAGEGEILGGRQIDIEKQIVLVALFVRVRPGQTRGVGQGSADQTPFGGVGFGVEEFHPRVAQRPPLGVNCDDAARNLSDAGDRSGLAGEIVRFIPFVAEERLRAAAVVENPLVARPIEFGAGRLEFKKGVGLVLVEVVELTHLVLLFFALPVRVVLALLPGAGDAGVQRVVAAFEHTGGGIERGATEAVAADRDGGVELRGRGRFLRDRVHNAREHADAVEQGVGSLDHLEPVHVDRVEQTPECDIGRRGDDQAADTKAKPGLERHIKATNGDHVREPIAAGAGRGRALRRTPAFVGIAGIGATLGLLRVREHTGGVGERLREVRGADVGHELLRDDLDGHRELLERRVQAGA